MHGQAATVLAAVQAGLGPAPMRDHAKKEEFRKRRNRMSAAESRKRKAAYVATLETDVRELSEANDSLSCTVTLLVTSNDHVKSQIRKMQAALEGKFGAPFAERVHEAATVRAHKHTKAKARARTRAKSHSAKAHSARAPAPAAMPAKHAAGPASGDSGESSVMAAAMAVAAQSRDLLSKVSRMWLPPNPGNGPAVVAEAKHGSAAKAAPAAVVAKPVSPAVVSKRTMVAREPAARAHATTDPFSVVTLGCSPHGERPAANAMDTALLRGPALACARTPLSVHPTWHARSGGMLHEGVAIAPSPAPACYAVVSRPAPGHGPPGAGARKRARTVGPVPVCGAGMLPMRPNAAVHGGAVFDEDAVLRLPNMARFFGSPSVGPSA